MCQPSVLRTNVQSQMALACDRKTDQGLKESAKYFQVGAWRLLRRMGQSLGELKAEGGLPMGTPAPQGPFRMLGAC